MGLWETNRPELKFNIELILQHSIFNIDKQNSIEINNATIQKHVNINTIF